MSASWRHRLILLAVLLPAAAVFCAGITWGLPSRRIDPFLFGSHDVWTGEQIKAFAGGRADGGSAGADVDRNPLTDRDKIITVNATDAQRAQILIRYRLYTYQPDEMITMMALASMHPGQGDFDPKLYQYGGLWIYPVGALLKAASVARLITLRTDLTYYLDYPEEFGRFYVVARLYVVAWALVGIWAVFRLTLRLTDGCVLAAAAAAACCAVMPVVVNMAHEAKPHLPGAVLILLAVLAAVRYVETGRTRWWIGSACLCGAALGMVLSAGVVFVIMPLTFLLRRDDGRRRVVRMLASIALGLVVYLISNPYVTINFFANRPLLESNFGNSTAMYSIGHWREALPNAAALIAEGTSTVLALVGVAGIVAILASSNRAGVQRAHSLQQPPVATAFLLGMPSLAVLLYFVALAAGKPGEYGRFGILPDTALAIAAATFVARAGLTRTHRFVALGTLVFTTAISGAGYLHGFVRDSSQVPSRVAVAGALDTLLAHGAKTVGVFAEPAPYVTPPFDLFSTQLRLLPRNGVVAPGEMPDVVMMPAKSDRAILLLGGYQEWPLAQLSLDPTPISWANKPFDIFVRTTATEAAP